MAGSSSVHPPLDISPSIAERTSSRHALNAVQLDGAGHAPSSPLPRKRRAKDKGKEPLRSIGGKGSRREQVKRGHTEEQRHSHGLSWSSTTRDSVVDNLLMSLDNLSSAHLDSDMDRLRDCEVETEKYRMPEMPQMPQFPESRPMRRARGHTYSSSLSSGYDGYSNVMAPGSPASKYSGSTKGRRSNSSSNFGTVSSRTQAGRKANGPYRISSDTQRRIGDVADVNGVNADIDSPERGQGAVLETNRLNWGGRRSMSMDQIYCEPLHSGSSVLERGRPVPSVHNMFDGKYEAAPEPGVPAGPRKRDNPTATGPVFLNQAPSKHSIRNVNTQSDLRTASKAGPPIPQYIQDQASDFVRNNSLQGVPSMPFSQEHNAPAPSPGFKSARRDAPSPQRERPGFFKRVFGSSTRTPSGLSSDSHDAFSTSDRTSMPDARSRSQASNDTTFTKAETRKTSREQSLPSHPPPALNKKPSSFFRRRKKSNTENLPPLPLPSGLDLMVKAAEPSPSISSLRKVMDPYLAHGGTALQTPRAPPHGDLFRPATQDSIIAPESDDLDIFHSGYTPPPDASLGWRDPLRRDAAKIPKESHDQHGSPRMKIKVKKRQTDAVLVEHQQPRDLAESSFLHDASREVSSITLGDHFKALVEEPKVSPVLESPSAIDQRERDVIRPVSRASTGDMIIASHPNSPIEPEELRNFGTGTDVSHDPSDDDGGFIIMHSPSTTAANSMDLKRPEHLYLKPTELEERRQNSHEAPSQLDISRNGSTNASLRSPAMHTPKSSIALSQDTLSVYHSTTSLPLPSLQIDGIPRKSGDTQHTRDTSVAYVDEGAEYRERARKIYDGDEEDVTRGEAASWLGEGNTLSRKTLQAYMHLFDFAGLNFLSALRMLCGKILLRGETQQFDRIVAALTERWCDCNPNHGFKAHDVVHTIVYSLILLNTDLHVVTGDHTTMSRNAYVKNTIPSLRRLAEEAVPNAFDETIRPSPSASRPSLPWAESASSTPGAQAPSSPSFPPDTPNERTSLEAPRNNASKRLSIRPGMFRAESDGWTPDSATGGASNALVSHPWTGNARGWEVELETVLKTFWTSIRTDPLPLLGSPTVDFTSADRSNLSVVPLGGLKRSGSVVSKAPSDMSFRSKPGIRALTMGWQNRNTRSRPKLYPASTVASSRTSFEDNNIRSPAQSSSWSKNSFARTLTSASVNSLGYHLTSTAADYKHSIGFANALSQAIIREEGGTGDSESVTIPGGLLEDEGLALEGAPWAKEGLVKHKHHLEMVDRKAKERSWSDCFAVISKGKLTLFAFGTSSKSNSMGRKSHAKPTGGRAASLAATSVGGGDWMENAEQLETFVLRHTIASTLPPPGYSKARPHVWALSLPSGAVHLFQVGTPEIALEFMTSANYWSARLSKEPLSGSVSNVEYGWSDQVINMALVEPRSESVTMSPPSSMAKAMNVRGHLHSSSSASGPLPRPSFQSSLRGSFDTGFGPAGRNRLPGDKAHVTDWQPPSQSMMASQLLEADQLRALTDYVSNVEVELERHNELKNAIELAYSPRNPNHHRSMANWQRKSDYLLREIVKFRTYMDSLVAGQKAKERFYTKRVAHVESASSHKAAASPVDSGRETREEERDATRRAPQSAG